MLLITPALIYPNLPNEKRFSLANPAFEPCQRLFFFIILTIAITWPLILNMRSKVPGWYIADNYEYLWKMWWFKHAIVDLMKNPLFVPTILYPTGFSLAYAEITPLHTIIGLPITLIIGEILTYNLFALASFVIAGWAIYLLIYKWTGNIWAGLFAGMLFILNPYHVVRYGGILPLMSIEGFPIFLLGVEGWISSRRFRWIILAAFGYILAAWSSIYYAFGLMILGPVYIIVRLATFSTSIFNRRTLVSMALLLFLVFAFTIPLALPYFSLGSSSDLSIPLQETDYWSSSPTDYIVPPDFIPYGGLW